MSVREIKLISGQMHYKNMTNKLSGKEYAIYKANTWMHLLNDGKRPTRWLKANSKGTKINFDFIQEQEHYNAGVIELEVYLNEINEKYDLGFKLNY